MVEEHGQAAKKVLRMMLYSVIALHVLLLFDSDTPTLQVLVGLVAHCMYLALLPQFPFVHMRSPIAICSAVAACVNHFSWFFHLLLSDAYIYTYGEICGIFVVCIWLCPLAFVVSLSSTEPLPISASAAQPFGRGDDGIYPDSPRGDGKRKRHTLFATFVNFLKAKGDQLLPTHHRQPHQQQVGQPAFMGAAIPTVPLSSPMAPTPAAATPTTTTTAAAASMQMPVPKEAQRRNVSPAHTQEDYSSKFL